MFFTTPSHGLNLPLKYDGIKMYWIVCSVQSDVIDGGVTMFYCGLAPVLPLLFLYCQLPNMYYWIFQNVQGIYVTFVMQFSPAIYANNLEAEQEKVMQTQM